MNISKKQREFENRLVYELNFVNILITEQFLIKSVRLNFKHYRKNKCDFNLTLTQLPAVTVFGIFGSMTSYKRLVQYLIISGAHSIVMWYFASFYYFSGSTFPLLLFTRFLFTLFNSVLLFRRANQANSSVLLKFFGILSFNASLFNFSRNSSVLKICNIRIVPVWTASCKLPKRMPHMNWDYLSVSMNTVSCSVMFQHEIILHLWLFLTLFEITNPHSMNFSTESNRFGTIRN